MKLFSILLLLGCVTIGVQGGCGLDVFLDMLNNQTTCMTEAADYWWPYFEGASTHLLRWVRVIQLSG